MKIVYVHPDIDTSFHNGFYINYVVLVGNELVVKSEYSSTEHDAKLKLKELRISLKNENYIPTFIVTKKKRACLI